MLTAPKVHPSAWIAPTATVLGHVTIAEEVTIFYGAVVRGDIQEISIGARSYVQDGCIIHVAGKRYPTIIGADVLIGHAVVGEGCVIGDGAFIGMKSTILEGTTIEGGAMLAAGSLLTPRKHMKTGELWGGSPAKLMRALSAEDSAHMAATVDGYAKHAQVYRRERGD